MDINPFIHAVNIFAVGWALSKRCLNEMLTWPLERGTHTEFPPGPTNITASSQPLWPSSSLRLSQNPAKHDGSSKRSWRSKETFGLTFKGFNLKMAREATSRGLDLSGGAGP